ncbi:hypothetical protein [Micromonospora sp. WMMD812]|uniref:hypothetical protein n=1 Tax=Micromonospora sp. WMMD812 TaxID=3015152 RepID=UPI00248D368D|nr:hypothetical protein [Micromonospora sp. WMMD812]WBB69047.1 hypothetical protein O7603_06770 [Micromonospora sp. WMMD812]
MEERVSAATAVARATARARHVDGGAMTEAAAAAGGLPDEVVELRVHGVSGASTEQVLDRPNVRQVAGDSKGGFYRPRSGYPDTRGPGGVLLEAYRWSDLPSSTAVRTISLLFLLPFMLCNVAIWMHPAGWSARTTVVKSLCRVLALTLTALYVIAVAGVVLDLIAWQCMASPRCLAGRSWLSWLAGQPIGLRLAVLALIPVAAIGLVWRLGARPAQTVQPSRAPRTVASAHELTAVDQWTSNPRVQRLRAIHVAAAFATLDAVLLTARAGGRAVAVTVTLGILTGGILAACLVLAVTPSVIDRAAAGWNDSITRVLRTLAYVVTAMVVVAVATDRTPWPAESTLPGYGVTVAFLFAAQTLLLLLLWAAVLWTRSGARAGPSPRAPGAPVVASVGTGVAVVFSSELVYRTADLLNRDAPAADRMVINPPLPFRWAIFGLFVAVVTAATLAAVVTLVSLPARRRAACVALAQDFPHAPSEAAPRLRQVEKSIARARFTERLGPLAVAYALLAGFTMATSTLGLLQLDPGQAIETWTRVPAGLVDFGIGIGSYVIAALVVGLVVGGIFAYRTPEFRRYVGVWWDLGTFWPRTAHPFAPPCYAERAVPELSRRITYLTGEGHTVLLTGHSHGSVLLAATVLQLPPGVGERVALLTYGSPLHRLYARWCPAYFGDDVLHEVGERVGWRWINLWRDTDPIGGWVFSPHRPGEPPTVYGSGATVDRRIPDPSTVVIPISDSVAPPIVGHRPAESDVCFVDAVAELADRLRGTH